MGILEQVQEAVKACNIGEYIIKDTFCKAMELYYIGDKLDLTRGRNTEEIRVTVYRVFESDKKYRGQTDIYIYPGMSDEEIRKALDDAYSAAVHIKNPYFNLAGVISHTSDKGSGFGCRSVAEDAKAIAQAIYSVKDSGEKGSRINSCEIFTERYTVRLISSSGTDVEYTHRVYRGEFVTQFKDDNADVEFYNSFEYDKPDTEALANKVREALRTVSDRAKAIPAPSLTGIPVILCGDTVREFLDFYVQRTNGAMVYPGYSTYKEWTSVQTGAAGDMLDIDLIPRVPYSDETVIMKERALLKNGIVKSLHGQVRFLDYLGLEQTGEYTKIRCNNEGKPMAELTKGPYILIKKFSDFQMDSFDASFGGEIRLGYISDGEKETIFTGGSISGNIIKAQDTLEFSSERYIAADYEGPAAVKFMI